MTRMEQATYYLTEAEETKKAIVGLLNAAMTLIGQLEYCADKIHSCVIDGDDEIDRIRDIAKEEIAKVKGERNENQE